MSARKSLYQQSQELLRELREKEAGRIEETDPERKSALVRQEVLKTVAGYGKISHTAELISMWEMYKTGEFLKLSPEYSGEHGFEAWADDMAPHMDDDYRMAFVNIIKRVFQFVIANRVMWVDQRITAEMLIEKAGVGKLKILHPLIGEEQDTNKKIDHIRALLNIRNQKDISIYRDTVKSGKVAVKLPEPSVRPLDDGNYEVTMVLNKPQLHLLELRIKPVVEESALA